MANEQSKTLFHRFLKYQAERFPFLAHTPLLASFTFSAISYSLVCRGETGFVALPVFLIGLATTLTMFFLLRVSDEFKDREIDAKFRSHLPVPRGLISLKELGWISIVALLVVLVLNVLFVPRLLWLLFPILLFLIAMRYEFGFSKYLKLHPVLYMLSHMLIMPIIDFYATGLDWLNSEVSPHDGLAFFLSVSYFNGIVIEWGRKIRSPKDESEGVDTYSAKFGAKRASLIWIVIVGLTGLGATFASHISGALNYTWPVLTILFALCALPALLFIKNPTSILAGWIEKAAGIWTIGMYLSLGAIPMIMIWMKQ